MARFRRELLSDIESHPSCSQEEVFTGLGEGLGFECDEDRRESDLQIAETTLFLKPIGARSVANCPLTLSHVKDPSTLHLHLKGKSTKCELWAQVPFFPSFMCEQGVQQVETFASDSGLEHVPRPFRASSILDDMLNLKGRSYY